MKQAELRTDGNDSLSAEHVRIYLSNHPNFFEDHEELLETLSIPHPSGSAVSLVEKQLQIYREKNEKLLQQLNILVQIARDNDDLFQKMHKLTLTLMDASDLETMVAGLQSVLHDQFKADFVSIRIVQDIPSPPLAEVFVSPLDKRLRSFQKIIDSGRPKCGPTNPEHAAFLFGSNADEVKSCSIIPFSTADVIGFLGIGSFNQERFLPNMGHMFLSQISDMIGFRLSAILDNQD